MFADTDAIRALGAASDIAAADLEVAAGRLSTLPLDAAARAWGPVAGRFLDALADAADAHARAVSVLRERACAGGALAGATAGRYSDSDARTAGLLGGALADAAGPVR